MHVIRLENQLGLIEVTPEYFHEVIGNAVAECYGVEGLGGQSTAYKLGLTLMRRKPLGSSRGVRVYRDGNGLMIDLHIIITYGLNISAIVRSIISKVCYTVEESLGLKVHRVNVFVDGMHKAE